MSTTLKNIKIAYPTEGVIRSAQLNDTVCPENSVQLAVNMNFDRVGAIQTRPGVETYATSLTGEIQNFGSLSRTTTIIFNSLSSSSGTSTSLTFAHTTSGDDRALFVTVVGGSSGDVITGVTYNGVAMSLVVKTNESTDTDRWRYLFKLLNPALGTYNVVISSSASTAIQGNAFSYFGVLSVSTSGTNTSGATMDSITGGGAVPTNVNDAWLVGFVFGDSAYAGGFTAGAGTVLRGSITPTFSNVVDSGGSVGTAGAHNLSVNFTTTAAEGFLFTVFIRPVGIPPVNFLYTQQGDGKVYALDNTSWSLKRTPIHNNQKARFAQYLNYIWMVNGNATIGDPVMTSNGGIFGTTLVPAGFPPGDSIQAGFEGRVWVMDSVADAVYYTDIVQFTPPNTYTLTYNATTNYLKNFSSQDGEKMTALWMVPRALLVFKQNHIYRIYGAASVDSYPAYNVGTFSQESIIQAKDGIYFHHSSGFYKFDYGGQPIEISRRIIDFVKAIPRASYENIVGVWDGFDNVKWTIGSITVEGVTYPNCQVRYTISTQVWTIYDYTDNTITALIRFDNGTIIEQIMGTSVGVIGKLDSGTTDFTKPIYYELIDRWRCFNEMYSFSKAISGIMVSSENGAGAELQYQTEKSPVDVWKPIDKIRDKYDALFPNASTEDFNNLRFRLRGNTSGTSMIFHAIELLSLQIKGLDEN